MADNEIRHRDRGDLTAPSGPVVDRAIARVGWWLPEAAAAGLLAGLAVWAGWGWALWPIGIGLAVRIGWEWAPARRSARFITTVVGWLARRIRRWRQRRHRTSPATPDARGAVQRDEVAS
ncbi:hypothetical protein DMH03_23960 [Amycolatopsis sp. WAC 01376]|uniref:hypothetical protein n=1 Tax=Amycolatopsis sp. WAC 01376 TaxID=2203195 RepID=UPI000F76FD34|nr:hypothetical protein [Amycolatopsis sp. WAC 01376]RSM58957.1 hypothetical protein DMH03_23960 [Amycolatopsis sp. WAC 01376]